MWQCRGTTTHISKKCRETVIKSVNNKMFMLFFCKTLNCFCEKTSSGATQKI